MKMRLSQFGSLVSALGICGCFRYLSMEGLFGTGEMSRYRPTAFALGRVESSRDIVHKAALLSLKRLPGCIQTIAVRGRNTLISATINQMDVFVRLRQTRGRSICIAVDAARPSIMGKAAVDTILEQTCRLARELALEPQAPEKGPRDGSAPGESTVIDFFPAINIAGIRREAAA